MGTTVYHPCSNVVYTQRNLAKSSLCLSFVKPTWPDYHRDSTKPKAFSCMSVPFQESVVWVQWNWDSINSGVGFVKKILLNFGSEKKPIPNSKCPWERNEEVLKIVYLEVLLPSTKPSAMYCLFCKPAVLPGVIIAKRNWAETSSIVLGGFTPDPRRNFPPQTSLALYLGEAESIKQWMLQVGLKQTGRPRRLPQL